ncbi:unnamed protein product [Adineta steineri]|uniref:Uncharacterized protein n=1 Tax=Adineta steineri TaxID=433720 RepID=A0A819FVR7_9BILA|nr:unnamed protein product [Adineta steineri]CAF3871824.1 unnamed protein product [Adineta steineri]
MSIRDSVPYIPINASRASLQLKNGLHSYFAPVTLDLPCASCGNVIIRHIEVIQWSHVLIVNINDSQKNVRFRKLSNTLSLGQFFSWLSIQCPSSNVYDLVCFNSIIRSGSNNDIVRVTKIKKVDQLTLTND